MNVEIKNISNRTVGITIPELRFSRTIKPNMSIQIPKETLEEAIAFPGVAELFNRGYITSKNLEVLEEIGGGYIESKDKKALLTEAEIIDVIENGTQLELDKILKATNNYRKDVVITAALKAKDISFQKAELIKKYTGKNVLSMKE